MIPFLDLRVIGKERDEIIAAIEKVLAHGRLINGPEVEELENKVAHRVGVTHAIGCGSGTDALMLALRAIGVGPGDEVIVPALSFIATANAVSLVGGTPVFADIGDDLNIDVQSIEKLITKNTRAIMPVHWTGRMCDMPEIVRLANRHGLYVIEDASQAFDASMRDRKAGAWSHIGCFSLNPMKGFAALGEAGMVTTNDVDIEEACRTLRYHGLRSRDSCVHPAGNSRLDTWQAAVLLVRLKRLDDVINKRIENAEYYHERLGSVVEVPGRRQNERHTYYTYTIQTDTRDRLQEHMDREGIETKIHHPVLMPHHPFYSGGTQTWPNAERLIKRILCLPVHEKLTEAQRETVADAVLSFEQRAAA